MRTSFEGAPAEAESANSHAVVGETPTVAMGGVASERTVIYAVITPAGALEMSATDDRISLDEWGAPYQEGLWGAVRHDVDPYGGEVNGYALEGDMRIKVADAAEHDLGKHPPNPIAAAVLTTLGHPPRNWSGTIAIVGREDDHGITASLTAEQIAVIGKAHRLAVLAAPHPAKNHTVPMPSTSTTPPMAGRWAPRR